MFGNGSSCSQSNRRQKPAHGADVTNAQIISTEVKFGTVGIEDYNCLINR